ncbi:MAG TPA: methyltransferase domain-containing protein [Allosphingosinicella sp.]|nr:methyltransferase domain-containing protein [Allosphingosinicella sp.]
MDEAAVRASRGPFAGRDGHLDAPYWTTPADVVERMLDLAGLTADDRLIDLGCGDGRIALAAAGRGARALGIDLDPGRIAEARLAAAAAGLESLTSFRKEDLFETPLADATVVSLYLLAHVNRLLERRLRRFLRPGSRVVSHAYPIGGWEPTRSVETPDRRRLYLWVVASVA